MERDLLSAPVDQEFRSGPLQLAVEIVFAADFADIFEARGTRREKRGTVHSVQLSRTAATISYTGLDRRTRQTELVFDPQPSRLSANQADFAITLRPGETVNLFIEIRCDTELIGKVTASGRFVTAMRDARRALRRASGRAASISTSSDVFNEAVRRAVSDLYMLITDTEEGPYPYAGIEGLFAVSIHMDLRRLPELFCGFPRQRNSAPTTYPVACVPQAWATAAPLSLVQSVLGLGFDFDPPRISFHQPVMQDFLEEIQIRKLSLGDATADVALRRSGEDATVLLLSRRGNIRVLTAA